MNKANSLIENSLFNVAYKLLNAVFPLITAAYIARVLFAEGVGEVSYAQNIVSYFTTIAVLGIPNYGIREIAKVKKDHNKTNLVFSELLTINAISTTLCLAIYCILIHSITAFRENISLFYAVGLNLIFNYANVDWFYQGYEEYGYIAKRSFLIKILSLISIFLFVKSENNVVTYALISSFATGGNYIFNIINLRRHNICLAYKNLNIKKHLRSIFIMLSSVIAVDLYTMMDTTMIGVLCESSAVGYYTNAMKLVKTLITVITAIGGVLLPRLSQYYDEGNLERCEYIVNKVFSIMLFLFVPCEIGIILTANLIMPVMFGDSFIPAIATLQISALLICTLGFSNLFGTQILLTFGQEKKLLHCTVIGAVSNVLLNSILIPTFQQNGAAIASVFSETLVTFMAFTYSRKYIRIKLKKNYILSVAASSCLMAIVVFLVKSFIPNDFLSLLLAVLCGVATYGIANYLTKNPAIREISALFNK